MPTSSVHLVLGNLRWRRVLLSSPLPLVPFSLYEPNAYRKGNEAATHRNLDQEIDSVHLFSAGSHKNVMAK